MLNSRDESYIHSLHALAKRRYIFFLTDLSYPDTESCIFEQAVCLVFGPAVSNQIQGSSHYFQGSLSIGPACLMGSWDKMETLEERQFSSPLCVSPILQHSPPNPAKESLCAALLCNQKDFCFYDGLDASEHDHQGLWSTMTSTGYSMCR